MISSIFRPKPDPYSSWTKEVHKKVEQKSNNLPAPVVASGKQAQKRIDSETTRKARKVRLATQRVAERRKHRADVLARKQAAKDKERQVRFEAIIAKHSVDEFVTYENIDLQIRDSWDEQAKKEEEFINSVHEYEMLVCMMDKGQEKEIIIEQIRALREDHKKGQEHFLWLIKTLMKLRDTKTVKNKVAGSEDKPGKVEFIDDTAVDKQKQGNVGPSKEDGNKDENNLQSFMEAHAPGDTPNGSGHESETETAGNTASTVLNRHPREYAGSSGLDGLPLFSPEEMQATVERLTKEKVELVTNYEKSKNEVKELQLLAEDLDTAITKVLVELQTNRDLLKTANIRHQEAVQNGKDLEKEFESMKKLIEAEKQKTMPTDTNDTSLNKTISALERKLTEALEQVEKISAEKDALSRAMDKKLMKAMAKRGESPVETKDMDSVDLLQKEKDMFQHSLMQEKILNKELKEKLDRSTVQVNQLEERVKEITAKVALLETKEADIEATSSTAETSHNKEAKQTLGKMYKMYRTTLHDSFKEDDVSRLQFTVERLKAEKASLQNELSELRRICSTEQLDARTKITELEDRLKESQDAARRRASDRAFPQRPSKENNRSQRIPFQRRENV